MSYPTDELTGYPAKLKTKTVHYLDYGDFDNIVNTHFPGINFEFVIAEECGNDSAQTFNSVGKYPLSDYDRQEIDSGRTQFMARNYLEALVEKGAIPPGDYVVEVCW